MPSKAELVCVHPERVKEIWPHAKGFIEAAMLKTELGRFSDIEAEILAGQQLLWLAWNGEAIEAAASTKVDQGSCTVVACGGVRPKDWIGLLSQIESYAVNMNCRYMRIYGRKGWAKLLPDYRPKFVILERAL